MGAGNTEPGGSRGPYMGREIRDLSDTPGTAARVTPQGGGRSSWQPVLMTQQAMAQSSTSPASAQ